MDWTWRYNIEPAYQTNVMSLINFFHYFEARLWGFYQVTWNNPHFGSLQSWLSAGRVILFYNFPVQALKLSFQTNSQHFQQISKIVIFSHKILFPYISGNRTFQERTFRAQKIKANSLYFLWVGNLLENETFLPQA